MTDRDSTGEGESYYASRSRIYPREVSGRFQRLRTTAVLVLLGLFYLVPWTVWDGRQAVLFDLPARKFYVLGIVFWPQDFIYLTGMLIIAALSLFLFTAIAGRLWCGYACPQTVWTETFIWIERLVEGNRGRQIRLDRGSLTTEKVFRKGLKHVLWIAFALWTGFTFVGFFTPIRELAVKTASFGLGPWELFWILFYGFATYGNAGWLREQVCIYMCPYARFQSAMFDRNTLIVSYDDERGEPRGSRRKSESPQALGLGSCVNCTLCVQVCPTGIDIRDGLQYECIGCAACIDVCDDVMEKVGYEPGLIRYSSQAAMSGEASLRLIRPRTVIYALVLIALMASLTASIASRSLIELDVMRDRNALYLRDDSGNIENVYTLKIINKDNVDHNVTVIANGISGLRVQQDRKVLNVRSGVVLDVPVRVTVPEDSLTARSTNFSFLLKFAAGKPSDVSESARFLGPG